MDWKNVLIIKLGLGLFKIENIYKSKVNIFKVNDINVFWNNNMFIIMNVHMRLGDYKFNIKTMNYNLYAIDRYNWTIVLY